MAGTKRQSPAGRMKPSSLSRTRLMRGSKTQITLTIAPDLLDRIDDVARKESMNRSAWIIMSINEMLRRRGDA